MSRPGNKRNGFQVIFWGVKYISACVYVYVHGHTCVHALSLA